MAARRAFRFRRGPGIDRPIPGHGPREGRRKPMRLLHYLEIRNFKNFGELQRIELDHPEC